MDRGSSTDLKIIQIKINETKQLNKTLKKESGSTWYIVHRYHFMYHFYHWIIKIYIENFIFWILFLKSHIKVTKNDSELHQNRYYFNQFFIGDLINVCFK